MMRCCAVSTVLLAVGCALLPAIMREVMPYVDKHGHPKFKGVVPATHRGVPYGFTHDQMPDLSGKVAVVTGGNSGLGYSTALFLARKGARTVIGCRSVARCDEAAKRIRANHSAAAVVPLQLDLASFKSVRGFAAALTKQVDRIDTLILNAGISGPPFSLSEDGIEMQFAVNHVGHQLLAGLLLPLVQKAAPSTVVVVASNAQWEKTPRPGSAVGLSVAEINDEKNYDLIAAYGQSKLANVLFAQELSERMQGKGVYVNSLHPGGTDTDVFRNIEIMVRNALGEKMNSLIGVPAMNYMRGAMWHPDVAALTSLYAAVSAEIVEKRITGKYFHPIARETAPCEHAFNKTLQTQLWDFTESLIKNPPKRP